MSTTPRPYAGRDRRPPDERRPDDLLAELRHRFGDVPLEAYRSLAANSGVPLDTVIRYACDDHLGQLVSPYTGR